jgi:hypothetical protein
VVRLPRVCLGFLTMVFIILQASLSPSGTGWAEKAQTAARAVAPNEPVDELRTITTASEAHRLSSKEAARAYPIHLRAQVTYLDRGNADRWVAMFVHDATGSIYVKPPRGLIGSARVGSWIDPRGVSDPGEFAPIVVHPQVTVIGYSGLPAPLRPSRASILDGTEYGKWVEVEGVVHSVIEDDIHVDFQLAMADGVMAVHMPKYPTQTTHAWWTLRCAFEVTKARCSISAAGT